MPLKIVRNNIIDMHADAIVNTANQHPVVGSGVDARIYHAAGLEELLEARRKIGNIPPGQAAITPAYKLNAKYIIHAVSPRWRGGHNCEEMLLKSTYESIMDLAVQHECRSVAMPLLATGNNHFPRGMSLDLAVKVATKYIDALDQLDKEEFTVSELMSTSLIIVNEDLKIANAIEVMLKKSISRLIVADNNQDLLGIVTRTDLINIIANLDQFPIITN